MITIKGARFHYRAGSLTGQGFDDQGRAVNIHIKVDNSQLSKMWWGKEAEVELIQIEMAE